MRNRYYILIFLLGLMPSLFSCSEDKEELVEEGFLQVDLSVKEKNNIITTKTSEPEVSTFHITIEKAGGTVVKEFSSYEELKAEGTLYLQAGSYTLTAHSPESYLKVSSFPYYSGTKAFTVLPNRFTEAKVSCGMRHAGVRIVLSEELLSAIAEDYEVSLSNGEVIQAYTSFIDGVSESWYFDTASGSFSLSVKGRTLEYDEPFDITTEVPNEVKPNDFLTIHLGVDTKTRSSLRSMFNMQLTTTTL